MGEVDAIRDFSCRQAVDGDAIRAAARRGSNVAA
jgi:hypothetical protein